MQLNRLKEIREDKDYSQKDIAKILKTTQQQYSKYELGIQLIPIDRLCLLADFYNVSLDYLLCRSDDRKIYSKTKIN